MSKKTFYYQFLVNKRLALNSDAILVYSIFAGLHDGAIFVDGEHNIIADLCIFEDITKGSNGACFSLINSSCVNISKCSAKSCHIYSSDEEETSGHFIYFDKDGDLENHESSFHLKGTSTSSCSSTIGDKQLSVIRVSYSNSRVADANITDCNTEKHSILFRQLSVTYLKRIVIQRMNTRYSFFWFENGQVNIENMYINEINYNNHALMDLISTSSVFKNSCFNIKVINIHSNMLSSLKFTDCYFSGDLPNHTCATIESTINSFNFGDPIICAGKIYEEIDNNRKGFKRELIIPPLIVKILFSYIIFLLSPLVIASY